MQMSGAGLHGISGGRGMEGPSDPRMYDPQPEQGQPLVASTEGSWRRPRWAAVRHMAPLWGPDGDTTPPAHRKMHASLHTGRDPHAAWHAWWGPTRRTTCLCLW